MSLKVHSEMTNLVLDFFKGDQKKTVLWFKTQNPLLGNISPNEMIARGREKKLLKFIKTLLDENKRGLGE